jgi:hypothetical protein
MLPYAIPRAQAGDLHNRAGLGEPEAKQIFAALRSGNSCYLCDAGVSSADATIGTLIVDDPRTRGWCLVLPTCSTCATLPPDEQTRRTGVFVLAMGWRR